MAGSAEGEAHRYYARHNAAGHRRRAVTERGPWRLLIVALIFLNAENATWCWYAAAHHLPSTNDLIAISFNLIGQAFVLAGVARRTRSERALLYQATHDVLTGLANRREFGDRLAATMASGRSLTVLFCDLDDFKGINDRLGHMAGDRVLIEVANRLRACVRSDDTLCRFGGDEFLILCPGASVQDAAQLRRRIEDALSAPVRLPADSVMARASVGIVVGASSDTPEDVIHRADCAMYDAKLRRRQTDFARGGSRDLIA